MVLAIPDLPGFPRDDDDPSMFQLQLLQIILPNPKKARVQLQYLLMKEERLNLKQIIYIQCKQDIQYHLIRLTTKENYDQP
jgi:hypothetical protein